MDDKTFVSDSLIRLTGASDPIAVDFVLAEATSAKSVSSLQDKLVSFLDGSPDDIGAFCGQLFSRVGKGSQPSASAPKNATTNEPTKKKYRLVDMGEDLPDPASSLGPVNVEAERDRRRRREKEKTRDTDRSRADRDSESRSRWEKDDSRKRDRSRDVESRDRPRSKKLRRKNSQDFDDRWGDEEIPDEELYADVDQEEFAESPSKRTRLEDGSASPRSASPADDLDPQTKQELDRQKDLRERDEFAKRLAKKEDRKSVV